MNEMQKKIYFNKASGVVAALAYFLVAPPVAYLVNTNAFETIVISSVCSFTAYRFYQMYVQKLKTRMESANDITWDVEVNRVKVGSISDAEFAEIRLIALSDYRLFLRQAWLIVGCVKRAISLFMRDIPIALFWIVAAISLFSPDVIHDLVLTLPKATSEEIAHTSNIVFQLTFISALSYFCILFSLGHLRFNFHTLFAERTTDYIRSHLGIAVKGDMALVRYNETGSITHIVPVNY